MLKFSQKNNSKPWIELYYSQFSRETDWCPSQNTIRKTDRIISYSYLFYSILLYSTLLNSILFYSIASWMHWRRSFQNEKNNCLSSTYWFKCWHCPEPCWGNHPKTEFNQISGHPLVQSISHVKLTIMEI